LLQDFLFDTVKIQFFLIDPLKKEASPIGKASF